MAVILHRETEAGRLSQVEAIRDTQWGLVLEADTQLCSACLKNVAFKLKLEAPMFCPVF